MHPKKRGRRAPFIVSCIISWYSKLVGTSSSCTRRHSQSGHRKVRRNRRYLARARTSCSCKGSFPSTASASILPQSFVRVWCLAAENGTTAARVTMYTKWLWLLPQLHVSPSAQENALRRLEVNTPNQHTVEHGSAAVLRQDTCAPRYICKATGAHFARHGGKAA